MEPASSAIEMEQQSPVSTFLADANVAVGKIDSAQRFEAEFKAASASLVGRAPPKLRYDEAHVTSSFDFQEFVNQLTYVSPEEKVESGRWEGTREGGNTVLMEMITVSV